jgi:hypothetical protein
VTGGNKLLEAWEKAGEMVKGGKQIIYWWLLLLEERNIIYYLPFESYG